MWLRKCLFACLILAAFCLNAEAARLVWDANTESDLAGYKIHYGLVSGQYTNTVDVGNVLQWEIPAEWPRDQSYCFAATAYNSTEESGYSNEVVYLADVPSPAAATDVRVSWQEVAEPMAYIDGADETLLGPGSSIVTDGTLNAGTTGRHIVVFVQTIDTTGYKTVTSVVDTAGNSGALCGSRYQTLYASTYYVNTECWLIPISATEAADYVTANFNAVNGGARILAGQWSGLIASPYDTGYDPAGNTDSTSVYTTTPDDTAEDNEIVIGGFFSVAATSQTRSSSSPSVIVYSTPVGDHCMASNVIATAGAGTVSVASTVNEANICLAKAFKSAAASAIKTVKGLAKASVKTIGGLAIASVKTWEGLP